MRCNLIIFAEYRQLYVVFSRFVTGSHNPWIHYVMSIDLDVLEKATSFENFDFKIIEQGPDLNYIDLDWMENKKDFYSSSCFLVKDCMHCDMSWDDVIRVLMRAYKEYELERPWYEGNII